MKITAILIAQLAQAKPHSEGNACEPMNGWNCMYPHHKHGAVCFKECPQGHSSGHHENNAYQECQCKHHECKWVELAHCKKVHHKAEVEVPTSETAPWFEKLAGMRHDVNFAAEENATEEVEEVEEVVEEVAEEAVESVEEETPAEEEEAPAVESEGEEVVEETHHKHHAPMPFNPMRQCPKLVHNHGWKCDDDKPFHHHHGQTCVRSCAHGFGHLDDDSNMKHRETCNCDENGCSWLVLNTCAGFHKHVYMAEKAMMEARNSMVCERDDDPSWNCSHEYFYVPGTICIKTCDNHESPDFHAVDECLCDHAECKWTSHSAC